MLCSSRDVHCALLNIVYRSLKWLNFIAVCEWTWDAGHKSSAAKIQDDLRTVIFHPNFSNGTAAVRGCAPMREGQHFWEIKMITPVYGTNMVSIVPSPSKLYAI